MATVKKDQSTKLLLSVETGVKADGSAACSQRTIRSVNPAISDENAYDVASAVGALQTYPLNGIARQDTSALIRE
ncbi:MAG: DUF1659 domain-containing protein [Schwartzia sp.]|nr:DUF1659 domain-containing protein [Schwartzia sp. (in: firmicutes)]